MTTLSAGSGSAGYVGDVLHTHRAAVFVLTLALARCVPLSSSEAAIAASQECWLVVLVAMAEQLKSRAGLLPLEPLGRHPN